MTATEQLAPIWLEVPGAVQRLSWREDQGPTPEQKATMKKAHSVTLAKRRCGDDQLPCGAQATEAGIRYVAIVAGGWQILARCVMHPELVIRGDDKLAGAFADRFPNHKKIYDIATSHE